MNILSFPPISGSRFAFRKLRVFTRGSLNRLRLLPVLTTCAGLPFLASCEGDISHSYQPEIIVEGSIDEGGHPLVMLGQSIPINANGGKVDLTQYIVRWAKVTVSDGENEVILTGKYNSRYFPPFIYTTTTMQGVAGKTYTLKVEYEGKLITAETTILPKIPLEGIQISPCADNDTLYQIKATFTDPKDQKNYYKLFTQVLNKESCYYSSFLGVMDDSALGDKTEIPVHRGMRFTDNGNFTPYYNYEDVVQIKFAQISKEGFDFWSSYENEVNFSSNLFFPVLQNLNSNIKGGKGIWCGYGSHVTIVSIAQEMNKRCNEQPKSK